MIYVTVQPASVLIGGAGSRDILFDIVNKQGTVVGEKPVVPSSSSRRRDRQRRLVKLTDRDPPPPSSCPFFPLRPFVCCFLAVPFFLP